MEKLPPPSIGIRYLLERLAEAHHMNAVMVEQVEQLARENAELKARLEPKADE